MKIKFIKQHLQYNIGDYAEDLPEGVAKYLVAMKVATDKEPDNEQVNSTLDKHLEEAHKKTKKKKD